MTGFGAIEAMEGVNLVNVAYVVTRRGRSGIRARSSGYSSGDSGTYRARRE
jgi:hypothetical protein